MSQPRKEEVCQEIQLEADGHKIGHKFAIKIRRKNCDAKISLNVACVYGVAEPPTLSERDPIYSSLHRAPMQVTTRNQNKLKN